jgi:RNA polymerase sigma factor (sigma-70 family)
MDQQIWKDIIRGDKQAYSGMYVAYYGSFFNYGRKFTEDTRLIEDVIQEVLMWVWMNREKLEHIQSFKSYLYTAFRHALFEKIRRSARVSPNVPDEPEFGADYLIVQRETDARVRQQLQDALNKLTPRQREAVFLRFYEDLSYEETAAVLHITVKATYKIMARALLELRDIMAISLVALLYLLRNMAGR